MQLSISRGNSKMGSIASVSLPAGVTCRKDCSCHKLCYAAKIERLRPSVNEAYQRNYQMLLEQPEVYWHEVENAIKMARFFRFHVSGDIPNDEYFARMLTIASRNPHCEILCFTKRYDIVNRVLQGSRKPENLHLILSAWQGLEMDNPYHLPEAHVLYKDGTTTAREDAVACSGNCTECAITNGGCWTMKQGEQVIFHQH